MHSLLDENERKRNLNLSKEVVLRTNEVSMIELPIISSNKMIVLPNEG